MPFFRSPTARTRPFERGREGERGVEKRRGRGRKVREGGRKVFWRHGRKRLTREGERGVGGLHALTLPSSALLASIALGFGVPSQRHAAKIEVSAPRARV